MKNKFLKRSATLIASLLFVCFTFQSCLRDNFDFDKLTGTEWDPALAVPLIYASMDVYDILAHTDSSDIFVIDQATGFIALVYEGEIFSFEASQVVQLPNQAAPTQDIFLTVPESTTLSGSGTVSKTVSTTHSFTTTTGVLIDSVMLKAGTLNIALTSDFKHSGSLGITLPGFKKNGAIFSATIPITYAGSTVSVNQNFDLTGYTADMTDGGTSSNKIPVTFTLTLTNSGNSVSPADKISITPTFQGMQFSRIFADFGNQTVSLASDSILVRIFNNAIAGTFRLVDPKITFDITNSFGFPVTVDLTTAKTVNLNSGIETPLTYKVSPPFPANIAYPLQVGGSAFTTIVIDTSNSNIKDLVTPTPKYFVYGINAESDSPSSPSEVNFITDQSRLKVDAEVELPLEGYAYGFTIVDTLNFELGENFMEVESVLLRTNMLNGFPVDVKMQLVFLDEFFVPTDSLFASGMEPIMLSGQVDAAGKVIQPTLKTTDVLMTQSRVPNLLKAKYVVVKGEAQSLEGTQSRIVKIYESYKLDVKVGMKIQGNIKL